MVRINKTPEFEEWFCGLRQHEQAQIEARLYRIQVHGHFGDCTALSGIGKSIAELRWKNGWRVYFSREGPSTIRLLIGGMKNGQKKDIKKAGLLLRKYAYLEE